MSVVDVCKMAQSKLTYFFTNTSTTPSPRSSSDPLASEVVPANSDDASKRRSESSMSRGKRLKGAVFRQAWRDEFPWLTYDKTRSVMLCSACTITGKYNSFTGEGCSQILIDCVRKHSKTKDHKQARIDERNVGSMDRSIENSRCSEQNGILKAMQTVYYLAKKNRPNMDFGDLVDFQIIQGVEILRGLKVDGHTNYRHDSSVKEFQRAMAKVVIEDLVEELRSSGMFGIILDESTDRSTDKTLIIYVKYHTKGEVKTRFLCVINLDSGTAENITQAIVNTCFDLGIDIKQCVAAATDGASVMVGIRSGVTTRLKQLSPYIVSVHCIAHRLSLAVSQAAHSVKYLDNYQETLNGIFKYYHYSHTRQTTLKNIQAIFEQAELKFKQVFDTRWLSFEGAVEAVMRNLSPLISSLLHDKSPLVKTISTYEFVATTYFLQDVLNLVGQLCRIFQKKNLDFTQANKSINSYVAAIGELRDKPGPNFQKFLSFLDGSPEEVLTEGAVEEPFISFDLDGNSITDSASRRQKFEKIKHQFLDNLETNLKARFPDGGLLDALMIFEPYKLPPHGDLTGYGNIQVETICDHFGRNKGETPALIDSSRFKLEWSTFKYDMSTEFRDMSFDNMCRIILKSSHYMEDYPQTCKLISVAICISVSSVDCERGFSQYNLIKTSVRNRLEVKECNLLMQISLN